MDLIEMGAQLLSDRLGVDVDAQTVRSALEGLMGDGQGQLDVSGLVSKFSQSGDISGLLGSWLGDGANQALSADAVGQLFGQESLAQFAGKVGTSTEDAASGLSDVIPKLIDQASSGGSLLDQFAGGGGAGGLLGAAKSLLG